MTALNVAQLRWLHDELGPAPAVADAELQTRYDELASVRDVALSMLRDRRARLLASPLSVNVSGVASVNNSENVKALERRIAALAQLDDDPTDTPGENVDGGTGTDAFSTLSLTRTRGR